jgi:hypothetical protein
MTPPKTDVTKIVKNQSDRAPGSSIKLIVLHTTEGHNRPGLEDLKNLASWFNNPKAQASSHIGNDAEGNDARFVEDNKKAWTCAAYNSVSLNLEQIGFSGTSQSIWLGKNMKQLLNTAQWIAYWSEKHNIPIRKARVFKGRVLRSGVIQHSDLGVEGGNHGDCGEGYPFKHVLKLAKTIRKENAKPAAPAPEPTPAPAKPKPSKPAASKPRYPGRVLKEGSKGKSVEAIQKKLKLTVDGKFGPKTDAAIRKFQKSNKLTVDGLVGKETWTALFG